MPVLGQYFDLAITTWPCTGDTVNADGDLRTLTHLVSAECSNCRTRPPPLPCLLLCSLRQYTVRWRQVEVTDAGLRQDFGFKHILWVYSGRRGVHCWVADDAARALTNEGRSAVADYFSVVAGNDNQAKKVSAEFDKSTKYTLYRVVFVWFLCLGLKTLLSLQVLLSPQVLVSLPVI